MPETCYGFRDRLCQLLSITGSIFERVKEGMIYDDPVYLSDFKSSMGLGLDVVDYRNSQRSDSLSGEKDFGLVFPE